MKKFAKEASGIWSFLIGSCHSNLKCIMQHLLHILKEVLLSILYFYSWLIKDSICISDGAAYNDNVIVEASGHGIT
jgi:hypothetical protein